MGLHKYGSLRNSLDEKSRLDRQAELVVNYFISTLAEYLTFKPLSVLDVGCGTRRLLDAVVQAYQPPFAFGLDISKSNLQDDGLVLRNKKPYKIQADARFLPGRANEFDIVFCRLLLLHTVDPERIISEMVRCTKPGGVVLAWDLDASTVLFYPESQEIERFQKAKVAYKLHHGRDSFIGRKLFTLFYQEGLQDVQVKQQSLNSTLLPKADLYKITRDWQGEAMVDGGFLTLAEYQAYLSALDAFFMRDDTFFSSTDFLAIGRKPKP